MGKGKSLNELFDWTDDRIATLERMWADGDSALQIGRHLGTTRNSVIGKVHRLGLERRVEVKPPPNAQLEAAARLRALREERRPAEEYGRVNILDLKDGECRYTCSETQPYEFCARPAVPGLSWCAHCSEIVFSKPINVSEQDRARRTAHMRKLHHINSTASGIDIRTLDEAPRK